jgi:hypothetical protein
MGYLALWPLMLLAGSLTLRSAGWKHEFDSRRFVTAAALGAIVVAASVAADVHILHLGWPARLAVGAALIALPAVARLRLADEPAAAIRRARFEWVSWLALAFALLDVADRILITNSLGITLSDELHICLARSLVMDAGERDLTGATAARAPMVSHADYPGLGPLLLTAGHALNGGVDFAWSRLPVQLFDLAFVVLLWRALRGRAPPLLAAGLLIVTVCGGFRLVLTADADRLVAFALALAIDGLWTSDEGDRTRGVVEAAVGTAMLAFTKHEGAVLAVLLAGCWIVFARPWRTLGWRRALLPPGSAAVVTAATWIANVRLGLANDLFAPPAGEPIHSGVAARVAARSAEIGAAWLRSVAFGGLASSFLLGAVVVLLVAARPYGSVSWRWMAAVTAAAMAIYFFVFAATPFDPRWHWGTAGVRVFSQLDGALALLAGALAARRPTGDLTARTAP